MRKVLFISRGIEPPWDEASRNFVKAIATTIEGYNFHLLTGSGGSTISKANVIDEKIYSRRQLDLQQKSRLALALLLKRKKYDIYHFCFVPEKMTTSYIRAIMPKDKYKVQTIPYIPDWALSCPRKVIFGDIVTVFSQRTERLLKENGLKEVYVIYPPVDIHAFSPLQVEHKDIHILYAGYLANQKMYEDISAITKGVLLGRRDVSFILAIRTKNKKEMFLKEKLKDSLYEFKERVYFMSALDDMVSMMKRCEIFIYPFFENFEKKIDIPFVIAEAMACAKTVIVSDKLPLDEIFMNTGGILSKAQDAAAFANEILELCSKREVLKEIGKQNRKLSLSLFDMCQNLQIVKKIYDCLGND